MGTLAERVADKWVAGLDMANLSPVEIHMLHAIKTVAIREWAKETLAKERGGH